MSSTLYLRSANPLRLNVQPALQPAHHLAVPELGIAGLQHPMVLVGEIDEPRGHALGLEHAVALEAVADGHPVVALAVDDEHRRLHVRGESRRIPAVDAVEPVPRLA